MSFFGFPARDVGPPSSSTLTVAVLYRMRVEEAALFQAFGLPYSIYAGHTSRLPPGFTRADVLPTPPGSATAAAQATLRCQPSTVSRGHLRLAGPAKVTLPPVNQSTLCTVT